MVASLAGLDSALAAALLAAGAASGAAAAGFRPLYQSAFSNRESYCLASDGFRTGSGLYSRIPLRSWPRLVNERGGGS